MSILDKIKNKFGEKVDIFEKSKGRAYVTVAKEDAKEVVRYLFIEEGARLSIASGVDNRTAVEILYHLAADKEGIMVSVRVRVPKPQLEMETFTDFMGAADWIEREIHEMFGVNFAGHANLKTLLLPDDWPEGVYPLRKQTFGSEKENIERDE